MEADVYADKRLFENVYVCRYCKHKMRISNPKLIREGKVRCRFCGRSDGFRPISKEIRETKTATTK